MIIDVIRDARAEIVRQLEKQPAHAQGYGGSVLRKLLEHMEAVEGVLQHPDQPDRKHAQFVKRVEQQTANTDD